MIMHRTPNTNHQGNTLPPNNLTRAEERAQLAKDMSTLFQDQTVNLPANTYLREEIRNLNIEMEELSLRMAMICDRIEQCAKQVEACSLRADREMFEPFLKIGMGAGKCFRILTPETERDIYYVVSMNSRGFVFKHEKHYQVEGTPEYYLDVYKHQGIISRVRVLKKTFKRPEVIA